MPSVRPRTALAFRWATPAIFSAYWMVFKEYQAAGHWPRLPRMMGFQSSGSAPLGARATTVEQPDTLPRAIPGSAIPPIREKGLLVARTERWRLPAVTDQAYPEASSCWAAKEGSSLRPPVPPVAAAANTSDELPAGARWVCCSTGQWPQGSATAIAQQRTASFAPPAWTLALDVVASVMALSASGARQPAELLNAMSRIMAEGIGLRRTATSC